jgi:hypothetical protein
LACCATTPSSPNIAPLQPRHAGTPDLDAKTFSAHLGPGDVEAQEAQRRTVLHDGDADDRLTVEPADAEGAGVGGKEGVGIGIARIPALVGGPSGHALNVVGAADRDLKGHVAKLAETAAGGDSRLPIRRHRRQTADNNRRAEDTQ